MNSTKTPGLADLYVAVEFELGTPFFGEPFVGFSQIVATSTSAAGIKKQVDSRWAHLLDSLWLKHDDEEQCRRDTRYVIYHIKADETRLDTSRDYHEKTYTLQAKWSLQQAEHWLRWAESVLLHAGGGHAGEHKTQLVQILLYAPKDPVIDDLTDSREEEIAEEYEEEGSRAICFACSI